MRSIVRMAAIILFGSAAILIAGCGGGGGGGNDALQPLSVTGANSQAGPATSGTFAVAVGGARRSQALQALDFFPGTITVDVGDRITWTVGGNAHTVTFLGPLTAPIGNPNAPFGGATYDGSAYTSSGALFPGNSYALTFTKTGSYPYLCLFHPPEMTGVVIVQPKGTPYPKSRGFYNGEGLEELNAQLGAAQTALGEFPYAEGGTTLVAGIAPGLFSGAPSNSTVLRFLDAGRLGPQDTSTSVTVPVGTTLSWVNQTNNEPHTVTFPALGQPPPPGDPFMPGTGPLTGQTYDGTALANSGPFFPGQSFSLTFTKAGTYKYFCLIHDDFGMVGTVTVR